MYITIEAPPGEKNYFLKTEVLANLAGLETELKQDPDICYLFSFTQYLRFMNLKLSGEYSIPDSRAPILLLARYMNANVAGVLVPEELIQKMADAPKEDREQTGIQIAADLIKQMKSLCQGVHVMAIGWEKKVPQIIQAAGL